LERRVWLYGTVIALTLGSLAVAAVSAVAAADGAATVRVAAYWLAGAVVPAGLLAGMILGDLRRLRQSVAREARLKTALEAALEQMPEGLAMYDTDLRLIWCNCTYRLLLGPEGEGLEAGDAMPQMIAGVARRTTAYAGRRIAIDRIEPGAGIVLSTIRDVTGEQETETRERVLRERYRQHLAAAGGWIWESDVLNRFSIVTPVRPETDPADLEWLIGRHLYELLPAGMESSAALESCLRDMAMQRRLHEVTLWLHDGRRLRSVRLSGVPRFDSSGNFLGYSGVGSFPAAGILPEAPPEVAKRDAEPAGEPPKRAPAPAVSGPRRLLVAEDSQTNRLLAQSILERMGYRVDAVENGRQAVEAVRDGEYAAVLMDVWMPELDGLKAAAEIRAMPAPKRSIPIVAMTAHASAEDRQRCIDAGMDEHVAKPIDRTRLSEVLHGLVGGGATGTGARPDPKQDEAKNDVPHPMIVDDSIIAELKEDAGASLVDELISTYMAETDDRLERMGTALQDGRLEDISADAHAMKSSSGTFGAVRLEALAAQIEAASTRRDGERTAALMDALPELVSATWAALGAQGHAAQDGGAGG